MGALKPNMNSMKKDDNLSMEVKRIVDKPVENGFETEVENSNDVALVFPTGDHFSKLQAKLVNIEEAKPVFKIKPEYKAWKLSEKSRGLFLGLIKRPGRNPGTMVPAVTWLAKEENGYVVYEDASQILVDEVSKGQARNVISVNETLLEIEYKGLKKTNSKNEAKDFEVRVLR
jgi:hypothetical protein